MQSLYVHIPFCMEKCKYCDFVSYGQKQDQIETYVDTLIKEIHQYAQYHLGPFSSLYIGGGTPSIVPPHLMERIFHALFTSFSISGQAEISIECNPGVIQNNALNIYKNIGVNRISMGAQSTNDAILSRIGRIHTKNDIFKTFSALQAAGFQNINVDIMHGLPGQYLEDYLATIQAICTLGPTHISAYSLIVEESTPLFQDVHTGVEILPTEEDVCAMQDAGIHLLAQLGYQRYEVSNFAKLGYTCRHNINYWENGAYIGLGAGAHSAWRVADATGNMEWVRFENPASLEAYAQAAKTPFASRHKQKIPRQEEAFETVMLGLRMISGVHLPSFMDRFHTSMQSFFPKTFAKLEKDGLLIVKRPYVYASPRGMDLLNIILQEFLLEMHEQGTHRLSC